MWSVILICEKIYEDILTFSICNDYLNTRLLNSGGGGIFGMHATSTECAFLSLDIFAEVATWSNRRDYL